MHWRIDIPLRDRDDRIDLNDLANMTREKLAGEDAQVARALALMVVTETEWSMSRLTLSRRAVSRG